MLLCPMCGGQIEAVQTICDACRSTMEEQVMAVRAADYPRLFQDAAHDSSKMNRSPLDPASMDMLKMAEQTSDDLDLVPLVPMDEPRKNGSDAVTATGLPSGANAAAVSSAMAAAASMAADPAAAKAASPVLRPSQALHDRASTPRLESGNRWKHVVIAVIFVAAAIILAMVLWSILVPRRGVSIDSESKAGDSVTSSTALARL
jgi:hypothetical protein